MLKIIFGAYDRPNINSIQPLISTLGERGHRIMLLNKYENPCVQSDLGNVLILDPPDRLATKANSKYSSIQNWRNVTDKSLSAMINKEELERLFGWQAFLDLVFLRGKSRLPILNCFDEYSRFVELALLSAQPELVVLCPGDIESEIIARCCDNFGIKYCFLLPQYHDFAWSESFVPHDTRSVHIVSSDFGRERLLRRGVDADKIILWGNLRLDKIYKGEAPPVATEKYFSGNILYAMQGVSANQQLLALLKKYLAKRRGSKLILRYHPKVPPKINEQIRYGIDRNISIDTNKNVQVSLASAAVLVTLTSGCILDALVCSVPVVCFSNNYLLGENPLARSGDVLSASNYGELEAALDAFLLNPEFRNSWISSHREIAKKYTGILDGSASQRGADILENLVTTAL